MKKIFIISLFIGFIAIFLSSSFEAKAQYCFDFSGCTVIDGPSSYMIYNGDIGHGCFLTFTYTFEKLDCDGQIKCTFTFIPPELSCGCDYYYNHPEEYIEDIMKTILEVENYPCKPQNVGDCAENIEFYLASCWKWDGTPISPNHGDPQPKLIPCSDEHGCCKMVWQVCKVAPDEYTATMTQKMEVAPCIGGQDCDLIICP